MGDWLGKVGMSEIALKDDRSASIATRPGRRIGWRFHAKTALGRSAYK
jgi:hypothetical protein